MRYQVKLYLVFYAEYRLEELFSTKIVKIQIIT